MEKISVLEQRDREFHYRALLILAGLRPGIGQAVQEEVKHMPLSIDIREHEVLGPMYDRAVEKGRQEGLQEGEEKGLQKGLQGQVALLRQVVEQKFGVLPAWASDALQKCTSDDLQRVGGRVLKATTLEELFG